MDVLFDRKISGERGSAAIVLMIILALGAISLIVMISGTSVRNWRAGDLRYARLNEKWQARSEVNVLASVIERETSKQLEIDAKYVRANCTALYSLQIFDNSGESASVPAASISNNSVVCNQNGGTKTSIFGSFSTWRDARLPFIKANAVSTFGINSETANVIEFNEMYRRSVATGSGGATVYAARYIVESKIGNYRTRTTGEVVLGNNVPGCGTTSIFSSSATTVVRGQTVNLNVDYSYASQIVIRNQSNQIVDSRNVAEQSAQASFIYTFAPSATGAYTVYATGSGGCQAQSAAITITVTEPPPLCPVVNSFSATPNPVANGGVYTVTWNVSNAVSITLNGTSRAASGSRTYGGITSATNYTLVATSQSGTCNLTQTITVNVQSAPSCNYVQPVIEEFKFTPAAITTGQSSSLSWNISGLQPGATFRITGANGFDQTVGSSGSMNVSPPAAQGDYDYTMTANNVCPDGTLRTSTSQARVTVGSCPQPNIDAFTINPSTVTVGGNQLIRMSWSISGSADTVSITDAGGGLPASGFLDISQPQSTKTYTLTTLGCGVTRQSQFTVTAQTPPQPPNFCGQYPGYGDMDSDANMQGTGGYANGGSNGNSEVRMYYKASHYSNNTYRFNLQFYVSASNAYRDFTVVYQTGYNFEIGDLRANMTAGGVNFYDASGNFIKHADWESSPYYPISGKNYGYRTYNLAGDFYNSPGVEIPYSTFNLGGVVKSNTFAVAASSIPYDGSSPSTPLNTGVGQSGGGTFKCP